MLGGADNICNDLPLNSCYSTNAVFAHTPRNTNHLVIPDSGCSGHCITKETAQNNPPVSNPTQKIKVTMPNVSKFASKHACHLDAFNALPQRAQVARGFQNTCKNLVCIEQLCDNDYLVMFDKANAASCAITK